MKITVGDLNADAVINISVEEPYPVYIEKNVCLISNETDEYELEEEILKKFKYNIRCN